MSEENDRLNSWKAIAAYLNRTVRTVQRWEREEGLPVHRHGHTRSHSVYAYKAELDAWLAARCAECEGGEPTASQPPADPTSERRAEAAPRNRPWQIWAALAAVAVLAGASFWMLRGGPPVEATHRQLLEPVPFTTFPGSESDPALSPDGELVAFSWDGENQDNFDIYVKPVDSHQLVRLTADPAPERCPSWSPRGDRIAFARMCAPGVTEILVASLNGGTPHKIAETRSPGCGITWSPDGQWLVTADRDSDSEPLGLYLISLETGEKRRLSQLELPHFTQTTAFSPSGRSLAFPALISGGSSDLFLLEFDETFRPAAQPRRLTFTRAKTGNPIWLAGGEHLIFSSGQWGGVSYLWEISVAAERAKPQRLASLGDDIDQAAYSPAANRLVCRRRHEDIDIWRLNLMADGVAAGRPARLLASTRIDYNPQISPDGRRIAFHSTRSGQAEIWVSDSDGSNAFQLTSMGAPVTGSPRWSPDGSLIAFDSNAAGNYDVYLVTASGGTPRRVVNDPADDGIPCWSHDGRWIYFASNRTGQLQIWKIPSAGGPAVRVTQGGGYVAFESVDGRFLYYQKWQPASPIWKVPVDGGPETQITPPVAWMGFAVTARGIYFIPAAVDGVPSTIQFLSFATGQVRQVMELRQPPSLGLAVSPDNRWLLFSQVDRRESDLVLVENFR